MVPPVRRQRSLNFQQNEIKQEKKEIISTVDKVRGDILPVSEVRGSNPVTHPIDIPKIYSSSYEIGPKSTLSINSYESSRSSGSFNNNEASHRERKHSSTNSPPSRKHSGGERRKISSSKILSGSDEEERIKKQSLILNPNQNHSPEIKSQKAKLPTLDLSKITSSISDSSSERSDIVYSQRGPKMSGSPVKKNEIKAKFSSYLPIVSIETEPVFAPFILNNQNVTIECEPELASFYLENGFIEKKNFNNMLISKIELNWETFKSKNLLPVCSLLSLKALLKNICFVENENWFATKRQALINPQRFYLAQASREMLNLYLIQHGGAIIRPILERLNIQKTVLLTVMQLHNKRTKWGMKYFQVLKELTQGKKLENNEVGLTEGVCLQEFLVLLAKARNHPHIRIKKLIESAISEDPTDRASIIKFLVECVNSSDDFKKEHLSSEIDRFDKLMILIGMIPNITHTCYEYENVPSPIESIEYSDTVRSIKEEGFPFIFDSMKINGETFYDVTLLPKIPYLNAHLSSKISQISKFSKEIISLINEQKTNAIISWLKDAAKTIPFYRKILSGFIFHSISSLSKTPDELDLWSKQFVRCFCQDEGKNLQFLIPFLLGTTNNKIEGFFKVLGNKELQNEDANSLFKALSSFWERALNFMINGKVFNQLCYLMAIQPWVKRNSDRFENMIDEKKPLTFLKLVKTLYSQRETFAEMSLAHYTGLKNRPHSKTNYEEVDRFLEYGAKKNSEIVGVCKKKPVPLFPVFRLYSVVCFQESIMVFQSLFPDLFKEPFNTIHKGGNKAESQVKTLAHFETTITYTFIVRRWDIKKTEEDLVILAEIPFTWTVSPHKNSWKRVLAISNTLQILPAATAQEALRIADSLSNINSENITNYTIETDANEGKVFTFVYETVYYNS